MYDPPSPNSIVFAATASSHRLVAGSSVQIWDADRFVRDGDGLRSKRFFPSNWRTTVPQRRQKWLDAVHPKCGVVEMKVSRINYVTRTVTFAAKWKVKLGRGKRWWR